MSQIVPNTIEGKPLKRLPKRQYQAAQMVAEDRLTDEAIAQACQITRRTLDRWKKKPNFAARVALISEEYAERIKAVGISRREIRVRELHSMFEGFKQVIRERANHADMQEIPGGKTGLVARREKMIGGGENAREVVEYEPDVNLTKEMRAVLQQTAEELGQKIEKHEIDARVGYFVLQVKSVAKEGPAKLPQQNG